MFENMAYWETESAYGVIPLSTSTKKKRDDAPVDGDEEKDAFEDFADDDEDELNDKDYDGDEEDIEENEEYDQKDSDLEEDASEAYSKDLDNDDFIDKNDWNHK